MAGSDWRKKEILFLWYVIIFYAREGSLVRACGRRLPQEALGYVFSRETQTISSLAIKVTAS